MYVIFALLLPGLLFIIAGLIATFSPRAMISSINILSEEDRKKIDAVAACRTLRKIFFSIGLLLMAGNYLIHLFVDDDEQLWITLFVVITVMVGIAIIAVKMRPHIKL